MTFFVGPGTLGTPGSSPGLGGVGSGNAPAAAKSFLQKPGVTVSVINSADGTYHELINVLGINIVYGYDVGTASATVELSERPAFIPANYSVVNIYCDAGPSIAGWPGGTPTLYGHPLRFSGIFLRTEATLYPHIFSMVCRGNLYRADQFRQSMYAGLPATLLAQHLKDLLQFSILGQRLTDLLNGASPTDQNIVLSILNTVPGLNVNAADIGGTGRIFGTVNAREFAWPPYRSALEMIQQFDQVCLGYRTYETLGGRIVRSQIFGYPNAGPAQTQFTEGLDIWEGRGTRTVEPLINAVYVEGAAVPQAGAGLIYGFIQGANPLQPLPVVEQFSSSWIEGPSSTGDPNDPSGISSPGQPLNAIDVALWKLSERNRELVNIQFTTFRDDLLLPGITIAVNSPLMAVQEPVWLQRVEIRMTSNPVLFQQTLYGIGGGIGGFAAELTYPPPPTY